jgi:hypothetical protein
VRFGSTVHILVCRFWPGAGAAPVSRGVRSLRSTRRRGDPVETVDGRHASLASAIEASSAVAPAKIGGSV